MFEKNLKIAKKNRFSFVRLEQTCHHVAVLLFRVYLAWVNDETQSACASKPCVWKSNQKDVDPIIVKDMKITKPKFNSEYK